jgi:hypothetical protein
MADDVQPDEGQGTEATGSQFDSYLQTVPSEAREAAESWFKDTSKGLNEKLDEAAAIRKTWEPYESVKDTLASYPPEQLSELLAWHQQVTSSDEAFKEWLGNASKEAGLTPAQEDALETAEATGELTREEVQKLIEEQAEQRVAPLREELTQFQTEQAVNAEEGKIRTRIDELQKEASVELTEEQKAMVFELGANDPGDDWVKTGFDAFRKISAEAQKAFVQDKGKAPTPSLTAGGSEKFKPSTDFKVVGEQAKERLRQMQT